MLFQLFHTYFFLDELKNWEAEICAGNVELSEEEQARLLEEYEKEIKERDVPIVVPEPKRKASKPAAQVDSKKNPNSKATKAANKSKAGGTVTANKKSASAAAATSKEESTSDESWEKDFDELDQQ